MWCSTCLQSLPFVLILARYSCLSAGISPPVTVSEAAPDFAWQCVKRKAFLHTFHLHALITLRWEPLLHDLSDVISLSSQTVLIRLVKPTQFILHHKCKPALTNWDSCCTLLILTFYHRFSTHRRFQLQSAAQLCSLGQVYASYRAAVHRIPYNSKARSWGREVN